MASRIVRSVHDAPHLKDRRITVRFVKTQIEHQGIDPNEFDNQYDLAVADVYCALTYYHEDPDEMQAVEQQRKEAIEAASHLTTEPTDRNG